MRRLKKTIMSVLLIVVSVLAFNKVRAEDTTYVQRFDMMAELLNRSEMKTTVLYDRVFPIAKLNKQLFTKAETDSVYRNYSNWKQVYLEMYNADYDHQLKQDFDAYLDNVNKYKLLNRKIPIGIIHYKYEYIDTMALHDGRVILTNEKLLRDPSNGATPFILDRATRLSVLADHIYTGNSTLIFENNFVYNNTGINVAQITIDFEDDKPAFTLKPNDTMLLSFLNVGAIKYHYSILFSNAETISSEAFLNVVPSGTAYCNLKEMTTVTTFTDYNNIQAGCFYEFGLYYSNCDNHTSEALVNPIIILDGFDPDDERKVGNIYDLMNEQPVQLADYLRAQGHDLIICNFKNGADFIERNALGVIQLIEYIKARTTDKIAIVGPSMGGLIAKYALAKMEKENIEHNTSLYVSFDAPHQGANIPIGDQYLLHFLGQILGNAEANLGLNRINTYAAREMLIHYYFINSAPPAVSNDREIYKYNVVQNSIVNSNGYPLRTRNVALINGSESLSTQGIFGKLLSMNLSLFQGVFTLLNGDVFTSPEIGTTIVTDITAVNPNNFYQTTRYIRRASVIPNNPYPSSLDNSPGGRYDTQYQITHDPFGNLNTGATLNHAMHSFVPSISGLDIKFVDGFTNYKFDIKNAKIVCNKLSPFVAYYAPAQNENHIQITTANAVWLKRELRNGNKTVEVTQLSKSIGAGQQFNYGNKTKDFYSDSFSVKDGGILGINRNSATGYNNEAAPTHGSHFTVEGYNMLCGPLNIEVSNHGKVIIGDSYKNTGEFKVSENSILHLSDLAELTIYDNSILRIEKGSKLLIGKNTKIELSNSNSRIIIEGTLEIEEDAVLSFIGEGHIELNTSDIILAKNAKIKLAGNSADDLVLKILNGKKIAIPFIQNSNNEFEVKNARIVFQENESYINSAIATNLNNVKIEGGYGIVLNGQQNVQIENCKFNSTKYGITTYATNIEKFGITGAKLKVDNSEFNNNEIAIRVFGKGFELNNISINNSKKGILADGIDMYSELNNSTINGSELYVNLPFNNAAVNYIADAGSTLSIGNTNINNFNVGIYNSQAKLNLKCSKILLANYYSIWVANNATLNMSSSTNTYAGNNTLSVKNRLNNKNVCLEYAANLNIANGANKFKIDADINNQFIAGTMNNIPNSINFKGNNWYTRISATAFLNPPDQQYFYIAQNLAPTAPRVQNFVVSPVLGNTSVAECDYQPINSMLPFLDPCLIPGSCQDSLLEEPLIYAANAQKVNIVGYPYDYYNIVLKSILNGIKTDSANSKLLEHFNSLCELYPLIIDTKKDLIYLKELTYATSLELFDKIYSSNNYNLQLQTNMDAMLNLHLLFINSLNNNQKTYHVLIDIAQMKSKQGQYDEALNEFRNALLYVDNETALNHINHYLCITELKQKMKIYNYSADVLDSLLQQCPEINKEKLNSNRIAKNELNTTMKTEAITIQPNPSGGKFEVILNNKESKIYSISVFNLQGKLINELSVTPTPHVITMDLESLRAGIYMLNIKTTDREYIRKIIITK